MKHKLITALICTLFAVSSIHASGEDSETVYFSIDQLHSYETAMMVIDPETGIILEASGGAQRFYGYPKLIGMNINTINTLSPDETFKEMQNARTENRNFFHFRHVLQDGSIREVYVNSYPMYLKDKLVLVSRITDVTDEIKRAERVEIIKVLALFILSSLVLLLTVFFRYTRKVMRERETADATVRRQLNEKEVLLREVHHRIKNNISSIEGMLIMQLQATTNSEAVDALQKAIGRIKLMSVLYEKLLRSGKYREDSIKTYLEDLIHSIHALFPNNERISIVTQIDDFTLSSKQLFTIGIIINELFTNIMKYAFEPAGSGIVSFSVIRKDQFLSIEIQDNGRGLPEGFSLKEATGFGLTIVKMLCAQFQGTIIMENRQGTLCRISLPFVG